MLSRSLIKSVSSSAATSTSSAARRQFITAAASGVAAKDLNSNLNSKNSNSNSFQSQSQSSLETNSNNNFISKHSKQVWFSTAVQSESESSSSSSPTTKSSSEPQSSSQPFIPTPERKYQFFQNVQITDTGIAIIKFDNPSKKVNTISFDLKDEAERLWDDEIHHNSSIKGVVFTSGKKDGFIAGADIFDIQKLEHKADVVPLIESATQFFLKLKSKNVPLVCAINGPALGGGLEWALWCDYRICTDSSKTKLGLPEVKLGLLPGFGGTQNLHRLVGLQKAMDMMLTGKDVRPAQAKKMGLVDLVVAPQSLEKVAVETCEKLASGSMVKSTGRSKKKSFLEKVIEDTSLGQYLMWKKVTEMVNKQTNGKYPAPFAIIDSVKYGLQHPDGDAKFKFEREAFAKLAATSESEALIGIFDGMTRMKKHEYGELAHPVKKVAVMGAGLMVSVNDER